jgi:hypothetical protein
MKADSKRTKRPSPTSAVDTRCYSSVPLRILSKTPGSWDATTNVSGDVQASTCGSLEDVEMFLENTNRMIVSGAC